MSVTRVVDKNVTNSHLIENKTHIKYNMIPIFNDSIGQTAQVCFQCESVALPLLANPWKIQNPGSSPSVFSGKIQRKVFINWYIFHRFGFFLKIALGEKKYR